MKAVYGWVVCTVLWSRRGKSYIPNGQTAPIVLLFGENVLPRAVLVLHLPYLRCRVSPITIRSYRSSHARHVATSLHMREGAAATGVEQKRREDG